MNSTSGADAIDNHYLIVWITVQELTESWSASHELKKVPWSAVENTINSKVANDIVINMRS